jgi:hypothetical protein
MICVPNFRQVAGTLCFGLQLLAIGLAGVLHAQTLTDIGSTAPNPGTNDISQLSAIGNQTWPDGINYFTDNHHQFARAAVQLDGRGDQLASPFLPHQARPAAAVRFHGGKIFAPHRPRCYVLTKPEHFYAHRYSEN